MGYKTLKVGVILLWSMAVISCGADPSTPGETTFTTPTTSPTFSFSGSVSVMGDLSLKSPTFDIDFIRRGNEPLHAEVNQETGTEFNFDNLRPGRYDLWISIPSDVISSCYDVILIPDTDTNGMPVYHWRWGAIVNGERVLFDESAYYRQLFEKAQINSEISRFYAVFELLKINHNGDTHANLRLSCVPDPVEYTTLLPNGLSLIEFKSNSPASAFFSSYVQTLGKFEGRMAGRISSGLESFGEDFEIRSTNNDNQSWTIEILKSGEQVYITDVASLSDVSGLVAAWAYNGHWAIEFIPLDSENRSMTDIVIDGQSICDMNNYQTAFGFQTIDGRPFYFFKKDDIYGVSYNMADVMLEDQAYDEILYHNFWIAFDPDPAAYEHGVRFWAKAGDEEYFNVLIGLFPE